MNHYIKLFLLLILVISGCKAKKAASEAAKEIESVRVIESTKKIQSFQIANIEDVAKEDLMFSIKSVEIVQNHLEVKVQYGGGCVKPHVFELNTEGVIDKNGNMDFYLLHKTHNDYCKALIIEPLLFDLEKLYNLQSEKLKTIRINDLRKMEI